ncbi:MAG: hypothetical protein ABJC64_06715, partial [Paracoccaceae bacterium]
MKNSKFSAHLFGAFVMSIAATMAGAQSETQIADENVVILSNWSVKLPFTLDENDPLTVGSAVDSMWDWITPGTQITSVNGIEIGNLNAVRAVLRMSTEMGDQTQLTARFGTQSGEEIAVLPIIQDTVLKNGMHFETIFDGQSWASILVSMPDNAVTDMRIGDRLISYGGVFFDGRKSVQDILQKDRRKGMMAYDVVFARDGEIKTGMIELVDDTVRPENRDPANLVILSQWNVQMPMEADSDEPARVSRARTEAVAAGDRIVSVNGIDVGNINAVSPVLRLSTEIEGQTGLEVELGIEQAGTGTVISKRMSLPIVQDTVLGNGMRFETKYAKHSWETYVVAVPDSANTDLEVGDRVLAYGTGTPINARTSIKDIIEAYRRKGMNDYEVVVMRDG